MVRSLTQPQSATALLQLEPVIQRHAACPLCHAIDMSLSNDALAAGGGWRCTRCGQQWDARRLAMVAAYAAWTRERDVVSAGSDNLTRLSPRTQPPSAAT